MALICPVASRITEETAEWMADVVVYLASEHERRTIAKRCRADQRIVVIADPHETAPSSPATREAGLSCAGGGTLARGMDVEVIFGDLPLTGFQLRTSLAGVIRPVVALWSHLDGARLKRQTESET